MKQTGFSHKPQLIGLMMIKDESDILDETLRNHEQFCDAILVLDGSSGAEQERSLAICRKSAKVQGYWRDQETGYPLPLSCLLYTSDAADD